jgi:hypothetical protein
MVMNESELAREFFRLTPKDVENPKLKFTHSRHEPDVVRVVYFHNEEEASYRRYPFYARDLGSLTLSNQGLIIKCTPNDDGPYELVDRLMQAYATAPQEA